MVGVDAVLAASTVEHQTGGALMDETTTIDSETTDAEVAETEELLVEEVSIDGMCGVY